MKLKFYHPLLWLFIGLSSCTSCQEKEEGNYKPPKNTNNSTDTIDAEMYLTLANGTQKLVKKESALSVIDDENLFTIELQESTVYQEMDGFGFAITGGSAMHLNSMSKSARADLLQELFGSAENSIRLSFIRISIGASDLDESPFSYADTDQNIPDPDLNSFNLSRDTINLIPVLKEILEINPDIKIMASPWSAPAWMKSNNSPKGGSLLTQYYDLYADYFVKYLQAMTAKGIEIEFITVQNEPLHAGNNPSMYMTSEEQNTFVKNHLGPTFSQNNINSKIIVYDHNADRIDYPKSILDDPETKSFVHGSAFHLYGGSINDLSVLHNSHPDKHIYFTEQWYGAPGNFAEDLRWHIKEVVIGSIRNWSRSVIEWNLSSNPELEPHTNGGCDRCLGAIVIDGDNVTRKAGYYVIGHISEFVPPGSQRIFSTYSYDLPNVAFRTIDNEIVLLVLNDSQEPRSFNVKSDSIEFTVMLDAFSVSTFKWDTKE